MAKRKTITIYRLNSETCQIEKVKKIRSTYEKAEKEIRRLSQGGVIDRQVYTSPSGKRIATITAMKHGERYRYFIPKKDII